MTVEGYGEVPQLMIDRVLEGLILPELVREWEEIEVEWYNGDMFSIQCPQCDEGGWFHRHFGDVQKVKCGLGHFYVVKIERSRAIASNSGA